MRGLAAANKVLIATVNAILEDDHPQTLRQLHYQIFSRGGIDYQNDVPSYRRLSRVLTNARRLHRQWELLRKDWEPNEHDAKAAKRLSLSVADIIQTKQLASISRELLEPFLRGKKELDEILSPLLTEEPPALGVRSGWIVDELRRPEMVSVWSDAPAYIDSVRESYRRDNWQDQPYHVELWGEKATVLGSMRPIMRKYGIALRVCRGFGSVGMEDQVGRLFEDIDKPIIVFYIGDHDASGELTGEDMHRRVEIASGVSFEMKRLAIHAPDIKAFGLPPQEIKDKDVRAKRFRQKFGRNAKTVELEALPVTELKRRVETAIEELIDWELWNRQIAVQDVELASIADFADRMKNLPQIGGGDEAA